MRPGVSPRAESETPQSDVFPRIGARVFTPKRVTTGGSVNSHRLTAPPKGRCGLEASTPGTQAGLFPEHFSVEYNDVLAGDLSGSRMQQCARTRRWSGSDVEPDKLEVWLPCTGPYPSWGAAEPVGGGLGGAGRARSDFVLSIRTRAGKGLKGHDG